MTRIHRTRCTYFDWLGQNARLPRLIESRINGRPTELNVQFVPAAGRRCSHLHVWSNLPNSGKCDFTVDEPGFRKVCARFNELARDESSRWNHPASYCPGKRRHSWNLHTPNFWRRQGKNSCILADVVFQVSKELAEGCSCLPKVCPPTEIGAVSIFEVAAEMVRVSKFLSDADIPADSLSRETIYKIAVKARKHRSPDELRLVRTIYAS